MGVEYIDDHLVFLIKSLEWIVQLRDFHRYNLTIISKANNDCVNCVQSESYFHRIQ